MLEQMLKHAKQEYPLESCGLVVFSDGVESYIQCKNIADSPLTTFLIAPLDYVRAEDVGTIVKIVHSHPQTPPTPSEADLRGIQNTQLPWIIINPETQKHTETYPTCKI